MTLQEKAALLAQKLDAIDKFWTDTASIEAKDFTNEQKQTIDTLNKEAQALNDEIEEAKGYDAERAKQTAMRAALNQPTGRPEFGDTDPRTRVEGFKSFGEMFVNSQEFKDFQKQLGITGPGHELADGMKIHMEKGVEIKALVITGGTPGTSGLNSGGALVRRDYDTTVPLPLRPLTIRQMISVGQTSSNLIEYVAEVSKTRAAAIVAEATSTTTGLKPESELHWEVRQTAVKTLAVGMPITRQILADAPQLQGDINDFLFQDLDLILEEEIISGAGGAGHFTGLENTPGITPHTAVSGDTDMLSTSRKAKTTSVVVARAQSTGWLMNPYDWETIDLIRNAAAGTFYFGGPTVMGVQQLWGIPVFESEVIPRGTAYTGDLKQMKIYDRESNVLRISDSHSDYFMRNILQVLAEMRAAFAVRRPAAIVKVDWLVGANS